MAGQLGIGLHSTCVLSLDTLSSGTNAAVKGVDRTPNRQANKYAGKGEGCSVVKIGSADEKLPIHLTSRPATKLRMGGWASASGPCKEPTMMITLATVGLLVK